jgi:hypothetical protein
LWTSCYKADVSENLSVRPEDSLARRLRLRARAAGDTLSDRLRRYAGEGIRRDEHPLITFRDGPTGRRSGVVGGPDVWEVVMWLEELSGEKDPVAVLRLCGLGPSKPAQRAVVPDAETSDEADDRATLRIGAEMYAVRHSAHDGHSPTAGGTRVGHDPGQV